ncbi:MAG: hypothetical protein A3E38_00300 [Candidatus Moranbacteria bacterium RIFCSPHIGHO2_12_FULL_54_9]|nr:MAG: hypothetical protein A2878_02175 [Candidatus Moranbacteria bacterium RIFCSPHIGHO2_01_FULL_54_31]OGI25976.1 MAG: hypothetical protein A3E38_00300 [Candidatus Moranbacteria bacterium RIFCSPHIGHO2_12_FULL_54_9]
MFKNIYKGFTVGQIEAVLNTVTAAGGIDALLRGDLEVRPKPFPFAKNEHGHWILTLTGFDLTGAEEIDRLKAHGFRVGDYATQCLMSTMPDSYDANHRLSGAKTYNVVIVPGKEVKENRTTANLRAYAEKFGYQKPLAGIMPRVREAVSDKQLEEMGIVYTAGLHDPIKDSDGGPDVLNSHRYGDGRWLSAYWDIPGYQWNDNGAFVFVVPE